MVSNSFVEKISVKHNFRTGEGSLTIHNVPYFHHTTTLDAGYVYAPYIPLMMTPTIVETLPTFGPTSTITSRYAEKILNTDFYEHVQINRS